MKSKNLKTFLNNNFISIHHLYLQGALLIRFFSILAGSTVLCFSFVIFNTMYYLELSIFINKSSLQLLMCQYKSIALKYQEMSA